jgi:ABC-type sulfate transport system permease component
VAVHAKYAVGRPGVAQVFNLPFAVPTAEAGCAEGLITGQDGKILDLVPAGTAAVGAVVADERAIAE